MHRLTERQKEVLRQYTTTLRYNDRCFIFGPRPKKYFKDAFDIFHALNIGYNSTYLDQKNAKPNIDSEQVYLHVDFKQAEKLNKVLKELINKDFFENEP